MKFTIEHLGLPARDSAALTDWYVKNLDARVIFCDQQTPPAFFVELAGGFVLEIYQATSSSGETHNNKLAGFRHLALRVDSIPTAKAQLESRGIKFSESVKPAGGGGNVIFFEDLDGNLLHLVERPAESPLAALGRKG